MGPRHAKITALLQAPSRGLCLYIAPVTSSRAPLGSSWPLFIQLAAEGRCLPAPTVQRTLRPTVCECTPVCVPKHCEHVCSPRTVNMYVCAKAWYARMCVGASTVCTCVCPSTMSMHVCAQAWYTCVSVHVCVSKHHVHVCAQVQFACVCTHVCVHWGSEEKVVVPQGPGHRGAWPPP